MVESIFKINNSCEVASWDSKNPGFVKKDLKNLLSEDRDSNPGKVGLQPTAVAAVPSPHEKLTKDIYIKLIIPKL